MEEPNFVRVGLVGCGSIAYAHGRALERYVPEVRFTACADVDRGAAKRFADRFGVANHYGDVAEMLTTEDLDGVFVATWPSNHLALLEECIRLGARMILCEKPLVLTKQEALKLWRVANKAGATILEGLMYRHHPAILRLDAVIRSGALGELDHVRACFSYYKAERLDREAIDPTDPNRPWRFRRNDGGGALYDIGVYAINACTAAARALPVRVAAFGRASDVFGVADRAIGIVEYANGCIGEVESTEAASTTQEIQVSGSLASVFVPQAWTVYGDSAVEVRQPVPFEHRDPDLPFSTMTDRLEVPAANGWACQLRSFGKMITRGEAPRIPLSESIINSYILDALVTGLETREVIELSIPEDVALDYEKSLAGA